MDGVLPVFIAATKGHAAVVNTLAAAGAEVDEAGGDGRTPLFQAVKNGHEATVQVLIAAGADVNKGPHGWPPLAVARRCQHHGVAALLEQAGARA